MVEEKPVAAFTLSLIGLSLQMAAVILLVTSLVFWQSIFFRGVGMMMPSMMWVYWPPALFWSALTALITGLVLGFGVLGVILMNTTDAERVKVGATLVLVASIIAFPTMFGFLIGSLLMFIGGILGLTWRP